MPKAALAIVALAAVTGLAAAVLRAAEAPPAPFRIDTRYVAIREELRGVEAVGYLSDVSPWSDDGTRLYTDTAYALAPTLVRRDPGGLTIHVATLKDPAALEAVAARAGVRIRRVFAPGVALLEGARR
jgi:hypothetical protein